MRIHPVVNVSQIVRYKEQIKGQKKEKGKPIEVEGVEEVEVEKILNKKTMRGVVKYLIQWKSFTAEGDTWERRENLKNAEELIEEFKQGEVVVRRQEREEEEYKRMEILGKFIAKLLYGWDDRKFEEEYLNKLEKNWKKWKEDRRWANRINKPRVRAVLKVLHGTSAEGLARVASIGRICSE